MTPVLSASRRRALRLGLLCLVIGVVMTIVVGQVGFQVFYRIPGVRSAKPETKELRTATIRVSLTHIDSVGLERYAISVLRIGKNEPRDWETERLLLRGLMDELPPPRWMNAMSHIDSQFDPKVLDSKYRDESPMWMFDAAGWPSRCFRSRLFVASWYDVPTRWTTTYVQAFGKTYWIPTGVIWLGVLKNVLFFAAATWCTIRGVGAVRALRRVRRGQCPRCAYNLKGQPAQGCPECGWKRLPHGAAA